MSIFDPVTSKDILKFEGFWDVHVRWVNKNTPDLLGEKLRDEICQILDKDFVNKQQYLLTGNHNDIQYVLYPILRESLICRKLSKSGLLPTISIKNVFTPKEGGKLHILFSITSPAGYPTWANVELVQL